MPGDGIAPRSASPLKHSLRLALLHLFGGFRARAENSNLTFHRTERPGLLRVQNQAARLVLPEQTECQAEKPCAQQQQGRGFRSLLEAAFEVNARGREVCLIVNDGYCICASI